MLIIENKEQPLLLHYSCLGDADDAERFGRRFLHTFPCLAISVSWERDGGHNSIRAFTGHFPFHVCMLNGRTWTGPHHKNNTRVKTRIASLRTAAMSEQQMRSSCSPCMTAYSPMHSKCCHRNTCRASYLPRAAEANGKHYCISENMQMTL